jgi:hypothetical protein
MVTGSLYIACVKNFVSSELKRYVPVFVDMISGKPVIMAAGILVNADRRTLRLPDRQYPRLRGIKNRVKIFVIQRKAHGQRFEIKRILISQIPGTARVNRCIGVADGKFKLDPGGVGKKMGEALKL